MPQSTGHSQTAMVTCRCDGDGYATDREVDLPSNGKKWGAPKCWRQHNTVMEQASSVRLFLSSSVARSSLPFPSKGSNVEWRFRPNGSAQRRSTLKAGTIFGTA